MSMKFKEKIRHFLPSKSDWITGFVESRKEQRNDGFFYFVVEFAIAIEKGFPLFRFREKPDCENIKV